MIQWWPIFGLRRKLTEQKEYFSPVELNMSRITIFKHSLFIYIIDVGASNALNFEIAALEAPQYNIHRFGIYFTDSPRHADVLLIIGKPVKTMIRPLEETITQLPNPFFIVTVEDGTDTDNVTDYPSLPGHVAALKGLRSPAELLGVLLAISKTKRKKQ